MYVFTGRGKKISTLDGLSNIFTSITWVIQGLWESKKHTSAKVFQWIIYHEVIKVTSNKLNKKRNIFDHPISCNTTNFLKLHHLLTKFYLL